MAKKYSARTSAPSKTNKYYYKNNIFYQCGYGIPNCTCYAWGRFYELIGSEPKLYTGNAETWYGKKDGYKRGKTPKLGAVICWRKGVVGNESDGAGHVAIVEKIYSDGSILTSNSAWGGSKFYTKKIKKGYALSGYVFQGFIYPPVEFYDSSTYTTGTYQTVMSMNIRTGAGTNYRIKKVKEITADGKKNATNKKPEAYAAYKKGTKFTATKIIKNSNGSIWAKTPSGYVCLKGKVIKYCKRV